MKVLLISIDSIINFYYDIGSKTDEELYKFAKDLINNNKEEELAIIFESLKDFEDTYIIFAYWGRSNVLLLRMESS